MDAGPMPGVDAGPRTPLDEVRAESTSRVIARLDEAGRLRTLIADLPTRGSTPEERAENFVEDHPALLPVPEGAELFVLRVAGDGSFVVFGMRVSGVVVYGAELRVHFDGDRVVWVSAALPADPAVAGTSPAIAEAAAATAAREAFELDPAAEVSTPERTILDGRLLDAEHIGPAVLTWTVEVDDDSLDGPWLTFVDATTGALIHSTALSDEALNRVVWDAGRGTRKPPTATRTALFDDSMALPPVPDTENDGRQVYEHLATTHAYFLDTFFQDGFDGTGHVETYVHWGPADARRAFHNNGRLYFCEGMPSLDVVAHEYTHGVVDNHADFVGAFIHGALNESFADVFASFIDTGTPWTIGDGSAVGVLRDLSDPGAYGQPNHLDALERRNEGACRAGASACGHQANCVRADGSNRCACLLGRCWRDSGWVHRNAGVPSFAAYLLVSGGTHPSSRIAVRGIGARMVETFWFGALVRLTRLAVLDDLRDAALATCLALVGTRVPGGEEIETRDCGATINAFAAIGVGPGDLDEDTVVDEDDNCPMRYNPEQEDEDHNGTGDICEPGAPFDAGPAAGLYCPAEMPASVGALPLTEEVVAEYNFAPGQANRITCTYGSGRGSTSTFWLTQFHTDGDVQSSACWTHHPADDNALCSTTGQQATVRGTVGDGFEDDAERAFLSTLLPIAEAEAIPCPPFVPDASPCTTGRIVCPPSRDAADGRVQALIDSGVSCPLESDPDNFYASCRYIDVECSQERYEPPASGSRTGGTFFGVSWATDAATADTPFTCTAEVGIYLGGHQWESGSHHAFVTYVGTRSAAVDAFATGLLNDIAEPRAAACP